MVPSKSVQKFLQLDLGQALFLHTPKSATHVSTHFAMK